MKLLKQFTKLRDETFDLVRKLPVSQKITILLLSLMVGGTVVLVVGLSKSEAFVKLGSGGDAKSVEGMKALLDRSGIPYRTGTDGGALEVAGSHAAQARWLAAENGIGSARTSNFDWLFGEGSFLDTESRIDQRLLESRKRTIEEAIRWSPNIRDARVVVQRGPEPIYASQPTGAESASVAVALRGGIEALTRSEAATIRNLVSGAFRIPGQNIQVTDDNLRSYPHLESSGAGITEEDDRTRKVVQTTVEGLLSRMYRPAEFVVGVLADFSSRRTQRIHEIYDPEKVATAEKSSFKETETTKRGSGAPVGVEPNVAAGGLGTAQPVPAVDTTTRDKKETVSEVRFTLLKEQTDVPAGELKGLSVNVVLDRAAVRRVLQAEEWTRLGADRRQAEKVESLSDIANFTVDSKLGTSNLDAAIDAYRGIQTRFLQEQLPASIEKAKVNVSVVMFPQPQMPVELAASERVWSWSREHWADLLMAGVAVLGVLVVYQMFRRALPQPLDVPPLDETQIIEEDRATDAEVASLEERLANASAAKSARATSEKTGDPEVDAMLNAVQDVVSISKESPETAAGVVKMWMMQDEHRK